MISKGVVHVNQKTTAGSATAVDARESSIPYSLVGATGPCYDSTA